MQNREIDQTFPVACEVGAVPEQQRERWMEVGRQFYASVDEIVELPDGYRFRASPARLDLIGEYVMRDRLCCAFIHWNIVVEQGGGPAWLEVRGPEGTQAFMRAAIEDTDMLRQEVVEAAGMSVQHRTHITLDNVTELANQLGQS